MTFTKRSRNRHSWSQNMLPILYPPAC